MKTLQDILNRLPRELRDIIEEYNVNHRKLMSRVLQDLTTTDNKCNFCKILVTDDNEDKYYGFYIYTWDRHKNIYCSPECGEVGDHCILKARNRWLTRLKSL